MQGFGSFVQAIWLTEGVSEFASALLGGAFAIGAQQLAVRHDRKKDAKKDADEKKARAWAIFFKLQQINEALSAGLEDVRRGLNAAKDAKAELWQFLQFPPHDWPEVQWEIEELVLLIDHKQFVLMQRYQEATLWLSNFIQSSQLYREMRVEFLRGRPSAMDGDRGVMSLNKADYDAVMPTIVHLRSLADSIAKVVSEQQRDSRKLLTDYVEAMSGLVGRSPTLEFKDENGGDTLA